MTMTATDQGLDCTMNGSYRRPVQRKKKVACVCNRDKKQTNPETTRDRSVQGVGQRVAHILTPPSSHPRSSSYQIAQRWTRSSLRQPRLHWGS